MNESSASQTIHQLNRFRMVLVILLPLSALLTPKDPSVYLSKWGVAVVTLYTLGCLSILCGDFLRTKWKIVDDNDIKENNIANWLFATGIIGYLVVCSLVKDHYLSQIVLWEPLFEGGLIAFPSILLIRFITRAICETRWGKFTGIHTILNKIAGYSLLFYIPLKTLAIQSFRINNSTSFENWFQYHIDMGLIGIIWIIFLIASVEELIIAITMKDQFDPFRKSIFQKRLRDEQ
jgi:Sec-independent protein secretion pathway component TatC